MNREEAKELLPWFAVGALEPDEARLVAAHLEDSPELKAELQEIQQVGVAVNAAVESLPELRPDAIQGALAQIDALEEVRPAVKREIDLRPSLGDQFREFLAFLFSPGPMRVAVAAQFALILVLGGALLIPRSAEEPGVDGAYTVASGAAGPAAVAGGINIDLVFQPTASEEALRTLLLELEAEIVGGPSPMGVYRVRFPESDAPADLLAGLRARGDLVRFATVAE